jgi:phosphoribosylamine---glycine ligase
MKRVLAIGGGGREHAIVKVLAKGGAEVFVAMKNRNPGIARLAKGFKLIRETDIDQVVQFAKDSGVELAVIGPEAPLEAGLADRLLEEGVGCVGPTRAAARIETSKKFARDLLHRYRVPGNLRYAAFDNFEDARRYILDLDHEVAVKPTGLTGGKGVKVQGEHLKGIPEVLDYVREIFEKGIGGAGVVLEERIQGEEFTLQAFCDGRSMVPMPLVQDHKRAFEGDVGPNTGGMGSYSMEDHLLPFITKGEHEKAVEAMRTTVEALHKEGCPYQGILYGQFMLTSTGVKIIEFNSRFGDPEAMNVLPILQTNFVEISERIVSGTISLANVEFARKATVCKYVVPEGYGMQAKADRLIHVDEKGIEMSGAELFYAAVNEESGRILTSTSRAVAVVGIASHLEDAEKACERALRFVSGEALYVRHDIGKKEIIQKKIARMQSIRR